MVAHCSGRAIIRISLISVFSEKDMLDGSCDDTPIQYEKILPKVCVTQVQ